MVGAVCGCRMDSCCAGRRRKDRGCPESNRPRSRRFGADPNYRKENKVLQISIKFNLVIQARLRWIAALASR